MTDFSIKVRTRHPSQKPLRNLLPRLAVRSMVRFGSSTTVAEVFPKFAGKRPIVEVNTIESVKCSANKRLMKIAFTKAGVVSANWFIVAKDGKSLVKVIGVLEDGEPIVAKNEIEFPIVAKHIFGSRGTGNHLLQTQNDLDNFIKGKDLSKYIFEEYYSYNREYRLHVTKDGCFYTCRKMLKSDVPKDKRWFRNDANSIWVVEENPSFDRPVNWKAIEADAVKALLAVGLDVGALDVRVQSAKDKKGNALNNPEWIIIETNSAPGLAEVGLQKYVETIPKIILDKHEHKIYA